MHRSKGHQLIALVLLAAPPAAAQESRSDAATTLDAMVITADKNDDAAGARRIDTDNLRRMRTQTSDSARLLQDVPGMSFNSAGGISSLPAIRGLADDRLRIQVDGMDLMSACPNHMNPALSYIDSSRVASVTVFAGIAPVSAGGDSIGGTIQMEAAPPRFAAPGEKLSVGGEAGLFSRSNGNARGWHVSAGLAGENLSLTYAESTSEADNLRTGKPYKPRYQSGPYVVEGDEVAAEDEGVDFLDAELFGGALAEAGEEVVGAVALDPFERGGDLAIGVEEVVALALAFLD